MRCKSCGIQLSANNIDNCPNCGTAEDQGKRDQLPRGLTGMFFSLTGLIWVGFGFAAMLGFAIYMATQSLVIAGAVFLGILAIIAFVFVGALDFG